MTGRTADGRIETVRVVPAGSPVANYAFDVTPARLVDGLDHRARRAKARSCCTCERIPGSRPISLTSGIPARYPLCRNEPAGISVIHVNTDIEIVVDDPTAPEADSPAVTSTGVVDVVVSLLLLVVAVTLGWDNWRSGAVLGIRPVRSPAIFRSTSR